MAPSRSKFTPKSGRKARVQRDDSASDPYSDELLSGSESPELLTTGEENIAEIQGSDDSDIEGPEQGDSADLEDEEEDEEDSDVGTEDEEEDDGEAVQRKIANVSFGALAKAQTALDTTGETNNKRKRGQQRSSEAEEKLRALRDRLRELQQSKSQRGAKRTDDYISLDVNRSKSSARENGKQPNAGSDDSDSGSDDEEGDGRKKRPQRSSKHAPAIQSSKKAVTRKRDAIATQKATVRDPRFDAATGHLDEDIISKRYGFVNEYRADEAAKLRSILKDRKTSRALTSDQKDDLKRQILVIESKAKAQAEKDRVASVQMEHKRKEKEAVASGQKSTPYFLKNSEVRERALVRKFEGMKGREVNRAVERRRKKMSQKERRAMPDERRNY